uniref:Secreted protein n=1 Tax=Pristionchus pacificus TaxID=54126 RepID=A0A8R1UQ00_PRIPA
MSLVFIASVFLIIWASTEGRAIRFDGTKEKRKRWDSSSGWSPPLAQVSSHHAFNWTSCFYEPPVAPAVDPSTVDVPAVLYAARDALNNPGLATGKVAH